MSVKFTYTEFTKLRDWAASAAVREDGNGKPKIAEQNRRLMNKLDELMFGMEQRGRRVLEIFPRGPI